MRIELRDVVKRFGKTEALRKVSFELPQGGRMALIGPNGAGKSTVTRIIMGMLSYEGDVLLDGHTPLENRVQLAQRLAYVPQIAPRLAAPVGELVGTVARLRGIDPAAITAVAHELQLDLDATRRRAIRDLSGGMRQKLLLALALSTEASLFVLDEPTASLDTKSRQRFFHLLEELPGNPSVLLCSHRLEEIRHLVDRVLVLEDGRVVHQGDAAEYLRRHGEGVLEVMVADDTSADWLTEHGFRRGASGWWAAETMNGDRLRLLGRVVTELGPGLRDVVLRDTERVSDEKEQQR